MKISKQLENKLIAKNPFKLALNAIAIKNGYAYITDAYFFTRQKTTLSDQIIPFENNKIAITLEDFPNIEQVANDKIQEFKDATEYSFTLDNLINALTAIRNVELEKSTSKKLKIKLIDTAMLITTSDSESVIMAMSK